MPRTRRYLRCGRTTRVCKRLILRPRRGRFGIQAAKRDTPQCRSLQVARDKGMGPNRAVPPGCRKKARLRRCAAWQGMSLACATRLASIAFLRQRGRKIGVYRPHRIDRRQLGVSQRQPLGAGVAEFHLHPCVRAASFKVDDDAGAEFGMGDALTDLVAGVVARAADGPAAIVAAGLLGRRITGSLRRLRCSSTCSGSSSRKRDGMP